MAKKAAEKPAEKASSQKAEKFTTSLKCELSRDEVEERASKCANLVSRIDTMTEDAKAAAKFAKAQIEAEQSVLRMLSNEVASKVTYRLIECERSFDYEAGVVTETRLDTLEIVTSRKMTQAERQRQFPDMD